MKYILVAVSAFFILGGCTAANKKTDDAALTVPQKPQIVDEEFDLLVAPEYDYESDVAYADQLKNDQPAQPAAGAVKPAKKPAAIQQ